MSGTTAVIKALKSLLRQSGITYAEAARALDLSEAICFGGCCTVAIPASGPSGGPIVQWNW
mgnify:CR=1 FL=1